MYSAQVLEHFQNPRHAGELEPCDVRLDLQNPVCGDVLRLTARVAHGRVAEVRFKAKGCVPAMACASRLMELVNGADSHALQAITAEAIAESMGGLPQASAHAASLAADAARELAKRI